MEHVVLVLGAGASTDYGYPLAGGLKDAITGRESGGGRRYNEMLKLLDGNQGSKETVRRFIADLQRSSQPSVDAFLERRANYMAIGKAAIAAVLMSYEDERELHRVSYNERWYDFLWDRLDDGSGTPRDLGLSIITFNYDRSLEQYLGMSMKHSRQGVTDDQVGEQLRQLNIIHVHGSLGALPFLEPDARPYQSRIDAAAVASAADRIQVFPTDMDVSKDPEVKRARDALRSATRVCFLGFRYQKANIDRLDLPNLLPNKNVYGTVMGMLPNEMDQARMDLGLAQRLPRVGPDEEAAKCDCLKYLRSLPVLTRPR